MIPTGVLVVGGVRSMHRMVLINNMRVRYRNPSARSTSLPSAECSSTEYPAAFKVSQNVGLGFGLKYFRDKLAPDSALQDGAGGSGDSFGVDLGVLWKVPSSSQASRW